MIAFRVLPRSRLCINVHTHKSLGMRNNAIKQHTSVQSKFHVHSRFHYESKMLDERFMPEFCR